jgi:hypothetical protein
VLADNRLAELAGWVWWQHISPFTTKRTVTTLAASRRLRWALIPAARSGRSVTPAAWDDSDDIAGCDTRSLALPADTCVSSRHHIPRTFAGTAAIEFRRRIAHRWPHAFPAALHRSGRADARRTSGIQDQRRTADHGRNAPPALLHGSLRTHALTSDRTRHHRRRADRRPNAFSTLLQSPWRTDALTGNWAWH